MMVLTQVLLVGTQAYGGANAAWYAKQNLQLQMLAHTSCTSFARDKAYLEILDRVKHVSEQRFSNVHININLK